jgi:hypothetical protein
MEYVKNLEEIKEAIRPLNKKHWEEDRTDLDLKYYVPTEIMCEALADYEIGISEEVYKRIEEINKEHYIWGYDIFNYYEENEDYEYLGGDNTYNHSGNVQNDFQWHTFKNKKVNDDYIVLIAFHLGGDMRGNYTDYIVLQFEYEERFLEVMSELSYEYGLTFDLEVDNKTYEITPLVFDECLEVRDIETDDFIYHIWANTDEEVIEQIREQVEKEEN